MARIAEPDYLHALKGTRATRAKDNGDCAPGRPKFPAGLSRDQRKTFKRLVNDLEERRHATKADREAIHLYCVLFERWQAALADVKKNGTMVEYIFTDKQGKEWPRQKVNPFLAIAQQTEKSMWAILQGLGLTPVARGKVKPAKSPDEDKPTDPFEEMMNRRARGFTAPAQEGENVN
jgi:P27 family predicted phage terminase small subunit